ncbi:hypothetical protein [Nocardia sp. NPDC004722]
MFFIVLFLGPVVCWAVTAETVRGRVVGVAILLAMQGVLVLVAVGVIARDIQVTVAVVLLVLIVVVLLAAPVVEARFARDEDEPGRIGKARIMIGYLLTGGYCLIVGLVLLITLAFVPLVGRPARVPPADAILPLPEGLSLRGTTDEGCSDGSTNECLRRFTLVGTGTPEDVGTRVREHLKATYGCTFPFSPSAATHDNSWSGDCAMHGWGLDKYRTSSRVWVEQDHVMVSLIYKDDY